MANINASSAVASASGLTTGTATTFFPQTNQPGEQILAELNITAAAETGTASMTAITLDGFAAGLTFVPTRTVVICQAVLAFTAGTTPTVTAQTLVNATGQETAVSLGQAGVLPVNTAVILAPTATSATPINCAKTGDAIKVAFAPTGAPTNWSGAFKVLVFGCWIPV